MSAPRKGAVQLWGVSRPTLVQATLQLATLLPAGGGPAPSAPVNLVAPSISGITEVGQVLTKTAGSWTGYPSPTLTWQWTKDGLAIAGAIGTTYTIVTGDIGGVIGGVETANNGVGGNITANSNNLGPVTNPAGGIQAPVLTKTSAAGVKPMAWSGSYPGSIQWDPATNSGDKMYMQWRVNGGAWVTTSAEQPLDAATLLSGQFNWPEFTTAAAGFTAGQFIEVEERKRRYSNNVLSDSSPFSNILSDTVAAAPFAPADLYAVGDVGYSWNTTDLTTIWQNNNGTTAGAFTSVVGRINDISGKGNHLNSLDNINRRPVLQNVASGMMKFDGVDDAMTLTACLWAGGAGTVIMAVKGPSQDGAFLLAETSSAVSGPVWAPGLRTTTLMDVLIYHRNDAFTATAVTEDINVFDDTVKVYAVVDSGTSVSLYVNGYTTPVATYNYISRASLGATSINQAHLGQARVGGTDFTTSPTAYVGSGIVINRALTAAELTKAVKWVGARHGVTIP